MPCTDGGPTYEQTQEPKRLRAALCAVLSVLEAQQDIRLALNEADWEEAGVTKAWVLGWWEEHKQEDAKRKAREVALKEQEAKKQLALAKLTPDERRILRL